MPSGFKPWSVTELRHPLTTTPLFLPFTTLLQEITVRCVIIADYLSLDELYRSLDLGEPHPSGSICCDRAQILLNSEHTHSNYHTSSN